MSEACDAVEMANQVETRPWPGQRARTNLNLARTYRLLDANEEALALAEEAFDYRMRAGIGITRCEPRQLIIECTDDEVTIARHQRVAEALARSLAERVGRMLLPFEHSRSEATCHFGLGEW